MTKRLPFHREITAIVHVMIVLTMVVLFVGLGSFDTANPAWLMMYLVVPAMVVVWSIVDIARRARILGYWGLAALMVPLAGLGIFGGYGLLYLIGIIFLLWAAWVENEGRA